MIGAAVRNANLDINKLMRLTRKARRRVLIRQGAYTRKAASNKIRRAPKARSRNAITGKFEKSSERKSSPAGKPPYTHTGALKRAIRYGMTKESVLIGPTHSQIGRIGHTHEFGGVEKAKKSRKMKSRNNLSVGGYGPIKMKRGKVTYAKLKTAEQVDRAKELARIAPAGYTTGKPRRRYPKRPFMKPTLIDVTPDLPKLWRDSVTG